MTTKDEALKMALNALEFSKSYLDDLADVHGTSKKAKPGSTSWHVDRAITACRAALAQKDEHDPVAWMLEWTFNGEELGQRLYDDETSCKFDAGSYGGVCRPLVYGDTTPPKRQPLTDEQRYALIKEHLGLDKRRDETVIDHRTGRWTDAARYFDLMDAAIETANGTGEQT